MNRKVLVIYYIISIAFLLVLVALGGYRIHARQEENRKASRQELQALRVALLSAVLAEGGFESDSLATAMRDNLRRTPRLRLLSVYSPEGGVYYLLSLDRQLVGQSADGRAPWTGEPDYALRPLLHLRVSVPFNPGIRAEGLLPPGLVMDGVFLRLSREDLYPILRELFFVLLVYLILTTILLLAAALSAPADALPSSRRQPRSALEPRRLPATPGLQPPTPQGAAEPEPGTRSDPENPGLYSPETGLGWRDFLPHRLSHELERAASSDQDLAFMLVALRPRRAPAPAERRLQLYRQLAQYTLESFPLRDLDFEYDPHAVAVILPDRGLDQGLETARSFQRKLLQAAWPGSEEIRVSVGLSARGGRLISGTRLLIEAGQALKKAESAGDDQIIAFRADPQKFRDTLSSAREA